MRQRCANTLALDPTHRRCQVSEFYQPPLFSVAKCCRGCGGEKPLDEFYRHPSMADGHLNYCKACCSIQKKKRYAEIAEKRRAYSRAYYAANREKQQAVNRRWSEANIEKRRAHRAKWRKANPVKVKQLCALRRNAPGHHSAEDLEQMYVSQEGLCAYCECGLGEDFQLDHMTPIIRGGTNNWDNLALTCRTCNLRKNKRTVVEFMDYLRTDVWT